MTSEELNAEIKRTARACEPLVIAHAAAYTAWALAADRVGGLQETTEDHVREDAWVVATEAWQTYRRAYRRMLGSKIDADIAWRAEVAARPADAVDEEDE